MSDASRWVLVARVALLTVAIGAVGVAVWIARPGGGASLDPAALYVCPMHPDVTSNVPGACPICRMELEAREGTGAATPQGSGVRASSYMYFDIPRRRGMGPGTPDPAWVDEHGDIVAVLYDDELHALPTRARAKFVLSTPESPEISVRATEAAAEPWDESTSVLRFRPDRSATAVDASSTHALPALPEGSLGWLALVDRGREPPLVPAGALLEDDRGFYVLVASAGRIGKRAVHVGKVFGGMAFVLSGLGPRDSVLTRSAFFVDAERQMSGQTAIGLEP